jgi:peptidoglycan hydrolase-like protein with peptidoglycan-binding domain
MGIGSRGNEITELQTRLTQEGVYSGPITGYYGNLTSEAVKRYQERHGISNTGYVGPITRERLNKGATVFVPPPQPLPQAKTPSETAQLQQYLELLKQLADLTEKAILLR